MTNALAILSSSERQTRQRLERVIEAALQYHLEAAQALREIRDRRLYRDEFPNFEDYCLARWHISRAHANRLCDWAEVSANVSPIGDRLPLRESHARPLARLTPVQQRVAWRRLQRLPHPTEKAVDQVCRAVRLPEAKVNGHPAPISWMGSKHTLAKVIIPLLPPHELYIEPYLGGGGLLFAKSPSKNEIVNDVDGEVVNFFRVLRSPHQASRLQKLLKLTPYSRTEHDWCVANPVDADSVEAARRFFVRVRQSYASIKDDSWGRALTERNRAAETASVIDHLQMFSERLRRVQIECMDAIELLRDCDRVGTCVFADPPYLNAQRHGRPYDHSMSLEQHEELLDLLCGFKRAKVLICGYDSDLYRRRLRRWKRHEHLRKIRASSGDFQRSRIEVIWTN